MTEVRDQLLKGLSETRNLVLGAQIFLGFQHQVLFQPGFESLSLGIRQFALLAAGLLFAVVVCLIAPTPRHRLIDRGDASAAQCRYVNRMLTVALPPFALAIGTNVLLATAGSLGVGSASALAVAATTAALLVWFGGTMMRRSSPEAPSPDAHEPVPLNEKIDELLTESRIVLPGVQALLGFQFVAYLTDAYRKLPADTQAVHTAGLVFLLVSMVLLMTPAPYHRLAERGENTQRFERIGTALVLAALPPLALGLASDLYVAVRMVTGEAAAAAASALVAATTALVVWFGVPLRARMLRRRRSGAPGGVARPGRA